MVLYHKRKPLLRLASQRYNKCIYRKTEGFLLYLHLLYHDYELFRTYEINREFYMFRFFKGIFRLFILIFIIGLMIFCYAKYIEPFNLKVNEIPAESGNVHESADGLKILAFADTHFGDYYTTEDFSQVLEKIEEIEPDMVFFLGDLIDNYSRYTKAEDVNEISELLRQIEAPFGKYAVFGNHDYGGGAENTYESIMTAGGFKVLANDYFTVEDLSIRIIGIDDVVIGYGNPETAQKAKEDLYNIVLTHAPDVANEIKGYNVDLILSGHTHGRQINIKYFDDYVLPPYGREYIHGLYELNTERESRLYVNAGIGMTQLPFRFLSPPELTVINLAND